MRVTCPNCDLKVLLDAASLSDAPLELTCARCAAPLRLRLVCEQAPNARDAATTNDARGPLAKKRAASANDGSTFETPRVVLSLEEAGDALSRAGALSAEETYRLGARLLNLSPLRLLLAGLAFVVLVGFCDLILASRALNSGDTALASLQNQATNRSFNSRRAPASPAEERDDLRDADSRRDGYDEATAPAADDDAEAKPAALSDKPAPTPDADAPVADARAAADSPAAGEVAGSNAGEGATDQASSKLTLQLASYRGEGEAQELAQKLQSAGFDARVVAEQNSKRPWYCVQVGTFAVRDEATQRLAELRAKGFASSYTVRELQ